MHRIAIVIYSALEGAGNSAVYRALMFARELLDAGDDVKLVFDGAGTTAHAAMLEPSHGLHRAWLLAQPAVAGSCGYCAKSYGVDAKLRESGQALLTDHKGHASLRALLLEERQIVTF